MSTERDWVGVVAAGPCPDCGLDATAVGRDELAVRIPQAAASWQDLLSGATPVQLRARPDDATWSPLEYAGHVAGVLRVFDGRVRRMLAEHEPDLGWWDHEAAVREEHYQDRDPVELGSDLSAAARSLSGCLVQLSPAEWARTGLRRGRERFDVEGLVRFAWHEVVHHRHDASVLLARTVWRTAGDVTAEELLQRPPVVPADIDAFSSNTLYGQPGIYPDGSPMAPAAGEPLDDDGARRVLATLVPAGRVNEALALFDQADLNERVPDPAVRAALVALCGGPAEPELAAFLDGSAEVRRLGVGVTDPGRVVGAEQGDGDSMRRVLNERYRAEHPAVIAPSVAHALCHHGQRAGNAEEATLHGLLGAVHTWFLSLDPTLGTLRTELARRQASLTITLLNARAPGTSAASIRCPDGPGTIPGGNPELQCPDLWSIPFTSRALQDCDLDVPAAVRDSLARLADEQAPPVPSRYDDALGAWLTEHLGDGPWFGPQVRVRAGSALGLFGAAPLHALSDGPVEGRAVEDRSGDDGQSS